MPRKRGPWYRKARGMFYGSIDGKQTPLGVTDPAALAAAWEVYNRLIGKPVDEGPPPVVVTCAAAVAAFLEDRAPEVKPGTVADYACTLKPFVARFGTIPVGRVEVAKIEADAAARGWSDTYRANYLCTVQQCLKVAGRLVKFRKPERESRGAESVIPEAVHNKVLLVAVGDWRAIIRFLWLTGCRPSEASGLTADAVDWPSGVVRIRDHKTRRHGKQRQLFLCPEGLAVLAAQREKHGDTGLLFRGKSGRRFSQQAFVMKFQRLSERVGHKLTSYGYRHSYATRALVAGTPDATVAALLGHSGTTMLHTHYSHLCSQARHLRDVAARLNTKPPEAQAG